MVRREYGFVMVAVAFALSAGCGGGTKDEGVTVTGSVTMDGTPLSHGQVVFEGANAEQRVGGIGEGGKFEVKGVPVGTVKAAVRTSYLQGQAAAERNFATKAGGKAEKMTAVMVPMKYENPGTANLEFTVEPGKPIDIALKK